MTILHFLESLSPFAHKKGWLSWENGLARQLTCPACHAHARMSTLRSVASPFSKMRRFRLYDCPQCGSGHFPDISAPVYEDQSHGGQKEDFTAPKKFYVEQGAGFEPMIAPFFWIQGQTITSLLEVGCGYGFSLDFAARALGWNARGVDPSHIARNGASELGLSVLHDYLNADTPIDGMPFDLVYSSEVIEHIADPDPFVEALTQAAGKHGTVLLTTPDIEGLREDRAIEEVIALLSPGSHLVLYSKTGLQACLERAGFSYVSVWSSGDTLYAFASNTAINVDFSAPIDRSLLLGYMHDRLRTKNLPHHLVSGFAGRLLRAQTDAGDYVSAHKTFDVLIALWKDIYDIELTAPDKVEIEKNAKNDFVSYAASRPFNLTSVLYCAGILALNDTKNQHLARAYFEACGRSYAIMEPVLTAINASDIDSRKLANSAALLCAGILTQSDPAKAVDKFERIDQNIKQSLCDHYTKTRLEVFAAAANSGDYISAERLRLVVQLELQNNPCINEFERAAALGLAMLALNHRFERPAGLFWLRKALECTPKDKALEGMHSVWAKQAAAYGVELLAHGGHKAFTAKRDAIGAALHNANICDKEFPVVEALGLAFLPDQPEKGLFWLEKALEVSNDDQRDITTTRIADAKTRVFLNAVNTGNAENSAHTLKAVERSAAKTNDPPLHFALGLDALNRRGDLDKAEQHFAAVSKQKKNPELAIQGSFHLAMVLARTGEKTKARKTANRLYAKTNPHADLVGKLVGNRQAELDAAIASAA